MSANYYDLLKYAATGIASPEMTYFDKMRALSMAGGTVQTLTGVPPLSFKANGKPLISWSILGNTQQTGTPSPDNIIMPTFCGKLVDTDWTIPITCAGQTVPVYLGQVQTVRRVKKLVLDGTENIAMPVTSSFQLFNIIQWGDVNGFCSHYSQITWSEAVAASKNGFAMRASSGGTDRVRICDRSITTVEDFKSYLAAQYAAGTPVTIWYVLATPETGIVNEPLAKIGDYADELHSTDVGVTIPTAKGDNTLTVDTDLQPSSVTIMYKS